MTNHDELCEKAKRVSAFAFYKLKETDVEYCLSDDDREMWVEIKEVADSKLSGSCEGMTVEDIKKILDSELYASLDWECPVIEGKEDAAKAIHAQMTGKKT